MAHANSGIQLDRGPISLNNRNWLSASKASVWRKSMGSVFVMVLWVVSACAQEQPSIDAAPACGARGTTFAVKRDESTHKLEAPEPGKARVYFIQDIGVVSCLGPA